MNRHVPGKSTADRNYTPDKAENRYHPFGRWLDICPEKLPPRTGRRGWDLECRRKQLLARYLAWHKDNGISMPSKMPYFLQEDDQINDVSALERHD